MTIEELESACDTSQVLDFSRQCEPPEPLLSGTFYPYGFPAEIWSNRPEVLDMAFDQWKKFEKRHDTKPIHIEVHVTDGGSTECPPALKYQILWPLLMSVADAENYSVSDLEQSRTHVLVNSGTLQHKLYMQSMFIASAPGCHLATTHITPIHAACVSFEGRGVLLCGDSGAGKSTLSYACARAGWTYTSDDASFLENCGTDRTVTGNCYQVRFRPTAKELFSELQGRELTPRLVGKPSIEVPTDELPHMKCDQKAQVDFIVFLNRRSGGPPELVPYRKDVARQFMRQVLYGRPKSLTPQYAAIDRMLSADVLELRYTDLDWAIERLQRLVREGH
jgi:hypothetical protein